MTLSDLLNRAHDILQGEPLRAIGYGAGVIVYLVARASGRFEDIPLDDAIILTGTAAGTVIGVIETARRYVFSPNTVREVAHESHNLNDPDLVLEVIGLEPHTRGDST